MIERQREDNYIQQFANSLEADKYWDDFKAEKVWEDLNVDLSKGYIDGVEQQAILNVEKAYTGLLGIKQTIGNDTISSLFVPETILKIYRRQPAFIIALSLSKEGFKQRIKRSFEKRQVVSAQTEDINYQQKWFPRNKKKRGFENDSGFER